MCPHNNPNNDGAGMPAKDCPFCAEMSRDGAKGVCMEHGQFTACTRPTGHEGDHVSCGIINHSIERWANQAQELEAK
jgi:hypothetical protein